MVYQGLKVLILEPVRDIGHLASWTLSSAKPDHGIEALLNPSPEHYWQYVPFLFIKLSKRSDGPQPHKLNILFPKRVHIRVTPLLSEADNSGLAFILITFLMNPTLRHG